MTFSMDKSPTRFHRAAPRCLVASVLAVLVLAIYWQVGSHPFLALDDEQYVFGNPRVMGGLTRDGASWALTTFHASNWFPLTWLSHMADVEMFGADAGWHHRVNVLFHLVNSVLLFLALREMTGATWRSGFAAALFAVHPLRVESVAWVAERKDVLSAFFWLLTMGAYLRYVRRPCAARYLSVAGLFSLALLSKAMSVTLPFALLLLDYWPLGRFGFPKPADVGLHPRPFPSGLLRLAGEKIPLFALSGVVCVITVLAQSSGALAPLERLSPGARISNALTSYVAYLAKTVFPASLAVHYPYPQFLPGGAGPWLQGTAAAAVLGAATYLALRRAARAPYLSAGWLWYLGTLVPVIGLVQVGRQSLADRFTYLPSVGLFVMFAWGAADLAPSWRLRRKALGALGCAAILALSAVSRNQAAYWQSGEKLFTHGLKVAGESWFGWKCLAVSRAQQGRYDLAASAYEEGVRIAPDHAQGWYELGVTYGFLGEPARAAEAFRRAISLAPDYPEAWYNLGVSLGNGGDPAGSVNAFLEAVRRKPDYAEAWINLGVAYGKLKRYPPAIEAFRSALKADADNREAWFNLGAVSLLQGDRDRALEAHRRLLRLDPAMAERLRERAGRGK